MKQLRVCSLFSGIGGIDLGFQQAGFDLVFANEFDADACATYVRNFPECMLVCEDIRRIGATTLPDFDVLTAGFPCQPFSVCGKQKGFEDERGNLFFDICRIIDEKKPPIVFLENVANLAKHDNGNTFARIVKELRSRGYHIKYEVVDACEHGLPQHRTRIYIVCFKDKSLFDCFEFPPKSGRSAVITDIIDREAKAPEALYLDESSRKYQKMLQAIDDETQLYKFTDYGIQKSDSGISFTLKANMGTWYDREPYIKDCFGIRKLSPEECLLFQGFPDSFCFGDIPEKSKYKQVGNSVCVPVIRKIAENIGFAVMQAAERTKKVLFGPVRGNRQFATCLAYHFYYIPRKKLSCSPEEVGYILMDKVISDAKIPQKYYAIGKVTAVKELPRNSILELHKDSDEEYIRFDVEKWNIVQLSLPKHKRFGVYDYDCLLQTKTYNTPAGVPRPRVECKPVKLKVIK